MAPPKRVIPISFWTDPYTVENYSVEDKYFILYLMTNPATTQVGIYRLSKKVMSFETGYTTDVINVLLDRFENKYNLIIYSSETQEITLLKSLTYSIMKGGDPVAQLLKSELSMVLNPDLILQTYMSLQSFFETSVRVFDQTIKRLFELELQKRNIPFSMTFTSNENENQNNNYNQNNNDNDNNNHNHIRGYESPPESIGESETSSNYINKGIIYYEHHFGKPTLEVIEQIEYWTELLSVEKVVGALALSKTATYPLKYASKILSNWHKDKEGKSA
ncbi:hypothetical protein ACEN33_10565 [Ruoffia sp. FAM 24228]|uniref:hypothetical protein n=1 Tax=unclassified Ruoffia TaxID=2862149 RepID=UPI00388B2769